MYSRKNVIAVKNAFKEKVDRAKSEAEQRKRNLYKEHPEVEEFDKALSDCYSKLIGIVLDTSVDRDSPEVKKKLDSIRDDSLQIQQDRKECLVYFGYPEDYTEPKYECRKCSDTGYVGINMCDCMRKALIMQAYESSGLASVIKRQTFENFGLDYYKTDSQCYENMKTVYEYCVDYADNFHKNGRNPNLLFIGGTGLGKTHLSTAIAKRVMDNGSDVIYRTAIDMFSDFEHDRFNRRYTDTDEPLSDKYYTCELLIIDDLGTELTNQFTVSTLYNLINKRVLTERPVIINTNLSRDELNSRYQDRVTSRMFGEFQPMIFTGTDVRKQKLAERYGK